MKLGCFLLLVVLMAGSCAGLQNAIPLVPTNDDDYVVLSDAITNDYRYVDEVLRFVYDEKYQASQLSYKIYANDGAVLYSDADRAFPIRHGRNYIELILDRTTFVDWGLRNPLLLEVTNAKQHKQYLKFNYAFP